MKRIRYLIPILLFFLNVSIKLVNFPVKTDFYSDAALRYRYARIFAEKGRLPDLDKKVLHPEGISPWQYIHPTMDAIIGLSYRIVNTGDFFSYTRIFIILFSTLSIVVFYFFARNLFKNELWATVLTFLYAVGPPAYWRVVGNYLREEFALPILFLGCLFMFKALTSSRKWHWFWTGMIFGIGLIIWHMSQFFYGIITVFLVLYTVFDAKNRLKWQQITVFVIPILVLSFIWPPLFLKHFFLSPQNFLIYALIIFLFITCKYGKKWQFYIFFILFLFLGLALGEIFGYGREYGHVFQTLFSKIYFLLQKPSNPNLLPVDARLLWMGPFANPGIVSFIFAFGLYPLIFIVTLILTKRKRQTHFFFPLLFFVAVFFFLYLLIARLQVFAFFFLILSIGFLFHLKKNWILIILLLFGIIDAYKGFTFSNWYQRLLPQFQKEWGLRFGAFGHEWHEITGWINKNIPKDEAILSDVDIGAMLLEKTEHPILIQPIYENRKARERVILFVDALYESEDSLLALAKKFKFKHILYHKRFFLDNSFNSNRYLTRHTEFSPEWISYRFQFFPDSLEHLHRIIQTTSFAFYSIDSTLSKIEKYSPFFDKKNYHINFGEEPSKGVISGVERNFIVSMNLYNDAVRSIGRRDYSDALNKLNMLHNYVPQFERSYALKALCLQHLNETARACSLYVLYLLENPHDTAVATTAFRVLKGSQKITVGRAIYKTDDSKEIYNFLKKVLNHEEFNLVVGKNKL